MSKKYYWLKLKNTYFNQLTQKKMKRQPNGKEMQIIYLRMLLSSIDKEGKIYYQGVYDSLEEELAEEFDEPVEIVKQTITFLIANNMVTIDADHTCHIPEAVECIGSEWDSAERMRRKRSIDKASLCDGSVTASDGNVTTSDTEIERELDSELEQDPERELDVYNVQNSDDPEDGTGIILPLKDGAVYEVPMRKVEIWKDAYPALNITQELRKIYAWLDSRPDKQKNRIEIVAFIVRWLSKEQDKFGRYYESDKKEETNSLQSTKPEQTEEPQKIIPRVLEEQETIDGELIPAGVAILPNGGKDYRNVSLPRKEWETIEEIIMDDWKE